MVLRNQVSTWILHELELSYAPIAGFPLRSNKALKGEAIVRLLRALNNAADESVRLAPWVKIDEKKDHHPIWHSGKMKEDMIFLKPSSIKQPRDSHQF